ncbi:DNA primase [Candidatus Hepatoplasma crinochetorum Av]|uniref:DNA primase n=1 Tax=Candidatus Hepatoplasma crinochetorum Av TaxID=1427984 RepID=W8GFA1_9MOLU|nr:DNA primase [Candidatus Hepatoplasma crinochetorum]AHK22439.1 DNA primase [Candidatus Hepatoplasma crinochetorum Av]
MTAKKDLNELIEKITNDLNIEDVISHYISLEKKGNSFVAICPFHQDSNPSLSISSTKKIFKCFVCNVGGNAITFVQKYKKVNYLEAIKIISEDFNLNWNDYFVKKERQEDPKIKEIKNINLEALNFYKYNLQIEIEKNKKLKDYLNERKFTEKLIEVFNIGWAGSNDGLKKYLLKKNFKEQEILRASLIKNNNGNLRDLFFNRLIFPIFNQFNDVLGFSGRVIDQKSPIKYLNSSQNLLFNKSKIIYNLNNATEEILLKDNVIIVEGFMDVISFYKIGIKNVVASMGTAFNINHIDKLKSFTKNFILSFDNDQAGIQTTIKTYNILKNHNINLSVINFSDGKDIDEIINNNLNINKKYFEDNKISFLDFYYQKVIVKEKLETLTEEKLKEILLIVLSYNDLVKKEIILLKIKEKFGKDFINSFIQNLNFKPLVKKEIIINNKINLKITNINKNKNFSSLNNTLNKYLGKYYQEEFKFLLYSLLSSSFFNNLIFENFIFINKYYKEIFDLFKNNKALLKSNDDKINYLKTLLQKFSSQREENIIKSLLENFQENIKNENLLKTIKNINVEDFISNLHEKWRIINKEKHKKKFIENINANDDEEYNYMINKLKIS